MKFFYFILLSVFSLTVFPGTKDLYKFKWLKSKKDIYVLQNKLHSNKKSLHIVLGYGFGQLSDFQDTTNLMASVSYYFSEEWGLNFLYSQYDNSNNDSFNAIAPENNRIPYVVRLKDAMGLLVEYSPFYGKLNTYNLIYYLDWNVGLGYGQVTVEDNVQSFLAGGADTFETNTENAYIAKTQLKFYLSRSFLLTFDFVNYFFNAKEPVDGAPEEMTRSYDLVFGVGLKF